MINRPLGKWNDDMPITAYELARSGISEFKISSALGINIGTYSAWKKKRPIFKNAIARGYRIYKQRELEPLSFSKYVTGKLPKALKPLWDEIELINDMGISGQEKIEKLFTERGTKRARQYLFIHAWVAFNFSISQAMRVVGIDKRMFYYWKENDPGFAELIEQILWHRKNFLEDSLFNLIASGDTQATIFANKTLNKDRGYSEKIDLNMNVSGEVNHTVMTVDELELSLEDRRRILESMNRRKLVTNEAM